MARYLPGDIVSRRKGFVMHKDIVLRDGRVLHNVPFKGEHICSEAEFRDGKRLYATRMEQRQRSRALREADRDTLRGYNLFTNNCEHTVHRAFHSVDGSCERQLDSISNCRNGIVEPYVGPEQNHARSWSGDKSVTYEVML